MQPNYVGVMRPLCWEGHSTFMCVAAERSGLTLGTTRPTNDTASRDPRVFDFLRVRSRFRDPRPRYLRRGVGWTYAFVIPLP